MEARRGRLAVSFKIADVNADGIFRSVEDDANSRVGSSIADDLCGRCAVAGHPFSAEFAQSYAVAYSEEFFLDLHRCCPITPAVLAMVPPTFYVSFDDAGQRFDCVTTSLSEMRHSRR